MKCKTLHKNLVFFLEGDLPEKEKKNIQDHLAKCPDCAAFAEEMRKTLGIIQKEKSPFVNPFFYTRLKTRLETRSGYGKIPVRQPILVKVVQPVFFSLLLIAGIYGGFKIGTPVNGNTALGEFTGNDAIPYLNEMNSEPIEGFLME